MNKQIIELSQEFAKLKARHEEASKVVKDINAEWGEVETKLIEALIEEGVKSIVIDGIGRVILTSKAHLSVNIADKPKMFAYMKDTGAGSLIREDCPAQTLTKWLGERLEELQKEEMSGGLDEVEAREKALGQLKAEGASFFLKRQISLRKD